MGYLIISNNPLLKGQSNVKFIEGSYLDTLVSARDMIHQGHSLISSPLAASIRMMFSPYRSILLGEEKSAINEYYIDTIESSIITYKKHMEVRNADQTNEEGYAIIDKELLDGAILEHKELERMKIMEVE